MIKKSIRHSLRHSIQAIIWTSFLSSLINFPSYSAEVPVKVELLVNGNKKPIIGIKTTTGYRFNSSSNKIVNLATLNWPPYIGEDLCNKGWIFQFTVALLVSQGYQVNIDFYPWARSVKLVETGQMDILFPEYYIEGSAPSDVIPDKKRVEMLALSNKFPGGEISFLKRKGETSSFNGKLRSLKGMVIGVVRGYQNTPEFDAMMDAHLFDVIPAVDELQLMKLLIAKRVDLIIGDPLVFQYSVNYSTLSNSNKQALLDGVEEIEPAIKYNYLYYAVSMKSKNWRSMIDDINIALINFKQSDETERYINEGSGCTVNFD